MTLMMLSPLIAVNAASWKTESSLGLKDYHLVHLTVA